MAIANNLVLSPKDFPALAEAMSQRQPGDKLKLDVEVTVVENMADRFSFDVNEADVHGVASSEPETESDDAESPLAQAVLGVMSGKKKKTKQ